MVAAYVAGYEVWAELMTREPDHLHSKGWHPTPIFGAVAAAAAAGCVSGLTGRRCAMPWRYLVLFAGGVMENFGTMAKPLHGGRAAQQGLEAVAFAMAGIDGSATAIEGDRGLLRALSPKGNVDVTLAPAFGERWHILKHKLNIKKYPTVGASQRTIDSILTTLKTMPIEPGRIRAILPLISVKQASVMQFHRPKTALEAKFSLEFAVAAALLHRAVDLRVLSDAVVQSPAMQAMMDRVAIETTEESDPGYPYRRPYRDRAHHLGRRQGNRHGADPARLRPCRCAADARAALGEICRLRGGGWRCGQASAALLRSHAIDRHARDAATSPNLVRL